MSESLGMKDQLLALNRAAREQGKDDEFLAIATLFWFEWHLNFLLAGNGYLDNDEPNRLTIDGDEASVEELKRFLRSAGLVGWYNQNAA